jgi:6-phosphofructo-2-kinase
MRLKLQGPDYKDKDPESSLADFRKRVKAYESAYVPLGAYEEEHHMQYIQMVDVGKKMIQFELSGFLANGLADYLHTFNLSPRQIWITRHGESYDNILGRIGGNADITDEGDSYAIALYNFVDKKRVQWEEDQRLRALAQTPLRDGTQTPPDEQLMNELNEKNFCVWTSMLRRSYNTAYCFHDDDNYDVKAWENLNELHAGSHEGMTYEEIARECPMEWSKRKADKLSYVYPGVGGEGYLQVISRLRDIVREIERIKDHVLIIGHRSICRVLLAYFMDLTREDITDLDVPLGMLYAIEPKPYGIEFHAYKYNVTNFGFDEIPNYKPQKAAEPGK